MAEGRRRETTKGGVEKNVWHNKNNKRKKWKKIIRLASFSVKFASFILLSVTFVSTTRKNIFHP